MRINRRFESWGTYYRSNTEKADGNTTRVMEFNTENIYDMNPSK